MIANALSAGFQRFNQRSWPVPFGVERAHDEVETLERGLLVGEVPAGACRFGYLFETLVVRGLRVFADVADGTVQHYRDSDDLEIDAVVIGGDACWAAFEVSSARPTSTGRLPTCSPSPARSTPPRSANRDARRGYRLRLRLHPI